MNLIGKEAEVKPTRCLRTGSSGSAVRTNRSDRSVTVRQPVGRSRKFLLRHSNLRVRYITWWQGNAKGLVRLRLSIGRSKAAKRLGLKQGNNRWKVSGFRRINKSEFASFKKPSRNRFAGSQ